MLSAHFDVSPEEQAVELARYLEELDPESKGIAAETEAKLANATENADGVEAILNKLVERSGFFWKSKDDSTSPIYALAKLCTIANNESAADKIVKLAEITAESTTDKPKSRAKALAMLFNLLELHEPRRYTVYLMLINFCGATKQIGALAAQQEAQLDAWLREWGCDQNQTRALYKAITDGARASENAAMAKKYSRLLLKSLDGADASVLAQYKQDAMIVPVETAADRDTYQFDDLTEYDAIKALSGEPVTQLLDILINGDVAAYKKFVAANAGFFEANKLDQNLCLRKMRLLTLVTLSNNVTEVSYADVKARLEIEDGEVEMWIIDAIRAGLVEARMDQLQQKMIVRRAMQRTFGREHWEKLHERLSAWTASVSEMLETMVKVREQTAYKRPA